MKETKDVKSVRYSYGITSALLAGGAAISLITGVPAGAQVAQNDRLQMQDVVPRAGAPASFADLTEALQPAVVNISTRQTVTVEQRANPFEGSPLDRFFNRRRAPQGNGPATREATSLGSGFIVSADGYVVTNNHVVAPGARATLEEVTVTLPDGTEYPAELIGTDPQSDLAVLKISRGEPFPFVRFGDSNQARVGDWVIAIGNPFGLGGTVTSGIVSALQRVTGQGGAFDSYIQTDAAINRGNSGGPLFDMQGNVIGINNAILSPSGGSVGIGLAIPAEDAEPIVRALIAGEEIERGYLGVQIEPVTDDIAEALGIAENRGELVQRVQPGEPAERAGLAAGDVVLTVNDETITRDNTLSRIVANIAPGTSVPVTFLRDGERRRIDVTVGRRPSDEELRQQQMFQNEDDEEGEMAPGGDSSMVEDALGISAVAIDPTIARQLGISSDTRGLAITGVDPTSDAARRGLARRVVILSANGRAVPTLEALESVIAEAREEGRGAILLRVQPQRGQARSIPVRLDD
ncbi:Do family serine endopeptidase [Aurantiacibacter aquimixticola]|uniref:Probable periplasmic serine endoprotease DegP-like n=1 Tax=Aurantiacibacter aquimixticola TaxID=1958945 RepID=A0A419RVI3_9SPHN|nr:Do family serine endopeptidase [Aurantiacibacter aquimixticola]RJY09793.1 Do family serine endopeptidase [Aurantiacibacter aquimixticola]